MAWGSFSALPHLAALFARVGLRRIQQDFRILIQKVTKMVLRCIGVWFFTSFRIQTMSLSHPCSCQTPLWMSTALQAEKQIAIHWLQHYKAWDGVPFFSTLPNMATNTAVNKLSSVGREKGHCAIQCDKTNVWTVLFLFQFIILDNQMEYECHRSTCIRLVLRPPPHPHLNTHKHETFSSQGI